MEDQYSDRSLTASVQQATGMISVQADCDHIEAFARLRIRAGVMDQSVEHTALDVLAGVIRFGP